MGNHNRVRRKRHRGDSILQDPAYLLKLSLKLYLILMACCAGVFGVGFTMQSELLYQAYWVLFYALFIPVIMLLPAVMGAFAQGEFKLVFFSVILAGLYAGGMLVFSFYILPIN